MRFNSIQRLLGAASVLALVTACSDATSPKSNTNDALATADLAVSAGDAVATDVGMLVAGEADGMTFTTAPSRAGANLAETSTCSVGSDGRRVCTATTVNGLTVTRSFGFYDATGTLQTHFDATTTESVNLQMSLSGTITRNSATSTITRERNMTLSGLAGTETQRTWNGTGSGTQHSVATGERGTRTYDMDAKDTTTAVVFLLPRSEHPWPQSGTVVRRMTATASFEGGSRSETRNVSRRAVVTFNGTSLVPLQIGDKSCTLNLELKTVSCPSA